jgi:hypothetical protein
MEPFITDKDGKVWIDPEHAAEILSACLARELLLIERIDEIKATISLYRSNRTSKNRHTLFSLVKVAPVKWVLKSTAIGPSTMFDFLTNRDPKL